MPAYWQPDPSKTQEMTDKPALFARPFCGYCYRVMLAARELGVDVDIHDIWADGESKQQLIEETGGSRVPVLRYREDSGETRWMPESRDIVAWLEAYAEKMAGVEAPGR